ncbi:MAG: hypothetical protein RMA76_07205 [Deltaproteobacteria bacterium]|jgi:mono/diheme cytochrome c family protein
MSWKILPLGLIVLTVVACNDAPKDVDTPPTASQTYQGGLRAVVESQCVSCHQAGGIGPFALDTYDALVAAAPAVVGSVEAGRMPPWMPDPDCRHFVGERLLTADQIGMFRTWMEAGMPEGDEADYEPIETEQQGLSPLELLGAPTAELAAAAPYTPNMERPDDYRCFPLAYDFPEETFLRASNIVPDQTALVHHVIVYLVEPHVAAHVEALDAREPGEGYTCFGGVGAGNPTPIVGWVPGNVPSVSSLEAMIRIPAGAKLVMQMHYNTLAGAVTPDQTMAQLWFETQRPEYILDPTFLPHLGIDIEAGDADSVQTRRFTNHSDEPWTVVATSPHMHLLGKSQRVVKETLDGSEECVLDVPRWDFNWQQGYVFQPGDELVVQPGETIRVECTYDNSAGNQPIVNGEQLEPRTVRWGEGTLDEMCLNTMTFVQPYAPYVPQAGGEICEGFQDCYDACKSPRFPMTGCMLQCGATNGCASCLLTGIIPCTSTECGPLAQQMLDCFDGCARTEDPNCIASTCTNQILSFDGCVRPKLEAGECSMEVDACGVTL